METAALVAEYGDRLTDAQRLAVTALLDVVHHQYNVSRVDEDGIEGPAGDHVDELAGCASCMALLELANLSTVAMFVVRA